MSRARVALTFDDGPGPTTPALLQTLAARGVRATFFVLGAHVSHSPDTALALARAGQRLGNHTWSHARPGTLDDAALADEIARTDDIVRDVLRQAGGATEAPLPLRLPYGAAADDPRLPTLARLGRAHDGWTGDFGDWRDPPPETLYAAMRAHIAAMATAGRDAVLDLHDGSRLRAARPSTLAAVARLLADDDLAFFTAP